jgi:molecular chaperone DnaK
VDSATKSKIDSAISDLEKAMEGEDVEEIKRLSDALTQVSHKLAEAMYQQAAKEGGQSAGTDQAAGGQPADDDVVDADFEEVKDNK